ncbi:cupin domain-containing protein [Pontibacter diazotrophicus]|uniref:Cupin domain-containing protein n=1 Tax=Pontibacter diazotrophicus TaxID=1400979 RepID=A0A3D8LD00_9BACT|nr:cupin domain-containing protein [Pontibacter diazotrophicus]RDV15285.1 cupin domain-containing protein [Pontibacter diazotrophicus]
MGKPAVEKVNLTEKFSLINDHWNPRITGELNGQQVKLAKFMGPFEWHHHEHEDEFFMVIKGQFEMHLRDKVVTLQPGEFLIVPRGVEHRPVAHEEAEVLMFEPASTVNTGNLENSARTKTNLERL